VASSHVEPAPPHPRLRPDRLAGPTADTPPPFPPHLRGETKKGPEGNPPRRACTPKAPRAPLAYPLFRCALWRITPFLAGSCAPNASLVFWDGWLAGLVEIERICSLHRSWSQTSSAVRLHFKNPKHLIVLPNYRPD